MQKVKKQICTLCNSILTVAFIIFMLAQMSVAAEDKLTVTRSFDPEVYEGESIVTVTISVTGEAALMAFSFQETLPNGWTFEDYDTPKPQPAGTPDEDDEGDIEFFWTKMPTLPYTFSYTVKVPSDASGDYTWSGVMYYAESGDTEEVPVGGTQVLKEKSAPAQVIPIITWNDPQVLTYGDPMSMTFNAAVIADGHDISNLGNFVYKWASNGEVINPTVERNAGTYPDWITVEFILNGAITEYAQPDTVTVDVIINKVTPVITWWGPANIVYGTVLSDIQLNATANVTGSFTYNPDLGVILPVGLNTLKVTFTPDDTVNYTSVTKTVTLVVEESNPDEFDFNWPTVPVVGGNNLNTVDVFWLPDPDVRPPVGLHLPYGTPVTDNLVLEGQISVAYKDGTPIPDSTDTGKFQFVVEKVYYPVGGPYNIFVYYFLDADKSDLRTDDYDGRQHQYLYIDPAVAELEWTTPEAITYGTALGKDQLDATCITCDVSTGRPLQGTFTYTPAEGTILDAGTHTLNVTFVPDNPNYLEATAIVEIVVNKADLTPDQFSWGDPTLDTLTYGDEFTSDNIYYATTFAGMITTDPDMLDTYPNAGEYPLTLTFTPDNQNYNPAIADRILFVNKATPIVVWDSLAPITYGTQLSSDHLNAEFTWTIDGTNVVVEGTPVYAPGAGEILSVGENRLNVTFTPNTDYVNNYENVTAFNLIYVKHADLDEVVWETPDAIEYGTPLSNAQYSDLMYGLVGTNRVDGTAADQNPAMGEILPTGEHTLTATFVPNDPNYNHKEGLTQTLTVKKASPELTIGSEPTNPQEIIEIDYGTLIDPADPKINASAKGYDGNELEGEFTFEAYEYDPTTGEYNLIDLDPTEIYLNVLADGDPQYMLRAIFTPTGDDADNYEAETYVEKGLNVLPVEPTVEVKDVQIPYGAELIVDEIIAIATGVDDAIVEGTFAFFVDDVAIAHVLQPLSTGTHVLKAVFTPAAEELNYVVAEGSGFIDIYGSVIIDWAIVSPITYGTELTDDYFQAAVKDAETGNEVAGTKVYSVIFPDGSEIPGQAGVVLEVGTYYLKLEFTPEDTASYDPAEKQVLLLVTPKLPVVEWNPAAMTYGDIPGTGQYNAHSDIEGSFDYPDQSEWPTEAGEYDLNAPFTPKDPNYSKVDPVIGRLVILKAPVRFVWPANDMNYGDNPTDQHQFNAKAYSMVTGEEVEGTFNYPINEMPTEAGVYTLVALWTPNDTRNYESGVAYADIEIFAVEPELSWNPAPLVYGEVAASAQMNAITTAFGHFEYPDMSGYSVGEYEVTANFISEDPNYENSEVTAILKVVKATPIVTWDPLSPIIYGTPLSDEQLNATASVEGVFEYNPGLGTILEAGTHILRMGFTSENENYTSVSMSVTIEVLPLGLVYAYNLDGTATVTGIGTLAEETGIEVPRAIEKDGMRYTVTAIGIGAFQGCTTMKSITLPASIVSIEASAFQYCSGLVEITIPESVKYIGEEAFASCINLEIVYIGTSELEPEVQSASFGENETIIVRAASDEPGLTIGDAAFQYDDKLKKVRMGKNVEKIGNGTFSGCESIEEITIPDSVTEVGDCAFENCTNLETVNIGENVETIGSSAFSGCESITEVKIPDSVTSLGESAFKDCSSLTTVEVGNNVETVGEAAFQNCASLTTVTMGESVASIDSTALSGCDNLSTVAFMSTTAPEGVAEALAETGAAETTIYHSDTDEWNEAATVIVEKTNTKTEVCSTEKVGNINVDVNGSNTGVEVDKGTKVTFTVTTEGSGLFYQWYKDGTPVSGATANVYEIVEAELSDAGEYSVKVSNLGDSAFSDSLTLQVDPVIGDEIKIGKLVYRIESLDKTRKTGTVSVVGYDGALSGTLSLPADVTLSGYTYDMIAVAPGIFSGCENLKAVEFPYSIATIGEDAFSGCVSLKSIKVDARNTQYSSMDGVLFNKDQTTLILCPAGCAESMTVPATVTSIGNRAFADCAKLIQVHYLGQMPQTGIGIYANTSDLLTSYCESAYAVSWNEAIIKGKWQDRDVFCKVVITEHPENREVKAGGTVVFRVSVIGSAPVTYQWYKDATPIEGATDSAYTISEAAAADEGSYSVTVSNAGGSENSVAASLTVLVISYHPADTDKDFVIDDMELMDYATRWLFGDPDIPDEYLMWGANIWLTGGAYGYQSDLEEPYCWVME